MASGQDGEAADKLLNDMVQDVDDYYARLNVQQANQTRIYSAVMGAVIWFAVFAGLGIALYLNVKGPGISLDLLWAFLTAVASGAIAGGIMYAVRRQRASKFAELGALLTKVKEGRVSSEDGLRLMDLMHQAALTMRKQRLDSAFAYGVSAFILVTVVGLNAGFGALAGVMTYLYFRFEALRDYEKEDERYEVAKKDIIINL